MTHPLVTHWQAFLDDFERRDDSACLGSFQAWITEWDRCFWAGDFSAYPDVYAADVRVDNRTASSFILDGFSGIEGFKVLRDDAIDAFSRFTFYVERFERAGERFAAVGTMRLKGRVTGIILRVPGGAVWTVRDGLIVRVEAFSARGKAVRALDDEAG